VPHFLLRLTPPRPSFPSDARAEELDAMVAHGAFWQDEADAGRALAVGPVADPDGIWGLALVEVADEAGARALAARDPVITAKLGFAYKVMPLLSLTTGRAGCPASDSHIRGRAEGLAPADI